MSAAKQGVRSIIPWSFMMGYLPQDIAWSRLTRRLVREYLDKFGYRDTVAAGPVHLSDPSLSLPSGHGLGFRLPQL